MFNRIKEEIATVKQRDPAARSSIEILLCYPGLWAILFHRLDYWLWTHNHKLLARFVSHFSRFITGIEIHPAARFGKRVFIDHGMGIVVGETAVVGNITLGDNCKIGAGSVVLRDVPPGTTAVGVPCRIVQEKREYKLDLDHNLPDPVAAAIDTILERQEAMERQLDILSEKLNVPKEQLVDDSKIEEIFKNYDFDCLEDYQNSVEEE